MRLVICRLRDGQCVEGLSNVLAAPRNIQCCPGEVTRAVSELISTVSDMFEIVLN